MPPFVYSCPALSLKRGSVAAMKSTALLCLNLVLQFGDYITGLSTDPPTENGGTVVVAALENATNVSIFCTVTEFGSLGLSVWFFTTEGGTRQLLDFDQPNAANFFTTGIARQNFTIRLFARNLDMAVLECNNNLPSPNREIAFFMLRIIG